MNLEHLQIALFAAYDIRNAMSSEDKDRPTENDTFGESINEVIDFLVELEKEMEKANETKPTLLQTRGSVFVVGT